MLRKKGKIYEDNEKESHQGDFRQGCGYLINLDTFQDKNKVLILGRFRNGRKTSGSFKTNGFNDSREPDVLEQKETSKW